MGYDKVFTKDAFAERLIWIATQLDTEYNNRFPYNLGYYNENGKVSWDCWNLPKSLIWGWQPYQSVGYYCYQPGLYGLDDLTGNGLMAICDNKSGDFTDVRKSAFLLTADKQHAGVYVGEFTDRLGQLCNVVEATTSWGEHKVIGSWVDPDGTRRNCKDGMISKAWAEHGELPFIDYADQPQPEPQPEPKPQRVVEDGSWGPEVTLNLQQIFRCKILDGKVSGQPSGNKGCLPACSVESWEFEFWPWKRVGSDLIYAMQVRLAGLGYYTGAWDRWCGPLMVKAIQLWLRDLGYYDGEIDGSLGPATALALQRWINAQ